MPDAFDLQEETQALQDLEAYEIPNEHDIYNEDPGALLEGASHIRSCHGNLTSLLSLLFRCC